MCGRFSMATERADLCAEFAGVSFPAEWRVRFNVAPGQRVAVVKSDGPDRVSFAAWGLVPTWARDEKIAARTINARCETMGEKPAFRESLRQRRCWVLADGFYEWRKEGRGNQAYHIRLDDGRPFAMAGLWAVWRSTSGHVRETCAVVTTQAHAQMAAVHDRMPVILGREVRDAWLDVNGTPADVARALCAAGLHERLCIVPVATWVNDVGVDDARCLAPAEQTGLALFSDLKGSV